MSRLGKCVLVLSLALSLTFFVVAPSAWAANPWGGPTDIAGSIALGTGIPADPYQISDPSELAYMAQEVNLGNSSYDDESYILTADLNMNGGLYYWTQIGTYTDRFEGNFNGNNHTISNLSINTPAVSCIGLFGFAQGGAVIENVVLANVNITGDMYVGTLVGSLLAGTVLNCAVTTGSVNGSFSVGGLVGDMGNSSQVDHCTAGVNVTGTANNIGGLVGLSGGSITNSAASGSVSGQDFTGGLIGYTSGAVSNSAASGSVSGQNAIGGLVGTSYAGGTVSNSAAIGDVSGTLEVGGLMGNDTGGTISGSAASGGVSGPSTVGGFIGWKDNVGGVSNNLSSGRVAGAAPIGSFAGRVLSPGTNVTGNAFDSQEGAAVLAIGTSVGSASAFTTAALTSGSSPGGLGGSWTYAAGYYPQISALVSSANSLVRAISALGSVPVLFGSDTDTSAGVSSMLKLPQTTGAAAVAWSASPSVLELHDIGDGHWYSGWTTPGTIDLTASAGGVSKKFTLDLTGTLSLREIDFNLGYAGGTAPDPFVTQYGAVISAPPAPTRAGYVFGGWFVDSGYATQWNFAADVVTSDMTLYAKWLIVPVGITATVDGAAYPLTSEAGGTTWSVVLPRGVANSAVSLDVALPAGAAISPALTGPLDFSGGPIDFTCIAADGTTRTSFSVRVSLWSSGINAVHSVGTGRFPLTLSPGSSFEFAVSLETEDGEPPSPVPAIGVEIDDEGTSLVRAQVVSRDRVLITALPIEGPARRGAGGSAIYGLAVITVTATQTLSDDSTLQSRSVKSLVVGEELLTRIALSGDVADAFERANDELVSSDVVILPGNTQPPLEVNGGWYLIGELDNAAIVILPPDGDHLPDCFEPTGKDAAGITIGLRDAPAGGAGLVPLTYIVTTRRAELESVFGAAMTSAILAAPLDHLSEIFAKMVIQKEICQGGRTGWFTRLVDGVISPRQAIDAGILEITGGDSLTMTLSYYVLDDSALEAFMYEGYLIVPDGANDGVIADPIWFNRWREGYAPGSNSQSGRGGGGGGCDGEGTPSALPIVLAAAALLSAAEKRNSNR